MFGNGLEIAGTTTIRVRSPTVVLGKAGSVVGALCAAAPIAIFRGSSARPSATGPNRQAGTTAAGSAWLEHCHEFPFVLVRFDHVACRIRKRESRHHVSGFKLLAADSLPGCIRIGAPQPSGA